MVLGWKYLHSMQRFWRAFCHFGIFVNFGKMPSKPLHGMGVGGHFGKMAKTRCVSDLALLVFVRYAASFGYFGKNGAKTRCVSD